MALLSRVRNITALGFLTISLASFSVHADIAHECAQLAAHPGDSDWWGKGVEYKNINGALAKSVCLQAFSKYPASGLVNVSLSRAFNKLEEYEDSFKHVEIAVKNDYPFAYYWMGIHYTYGDGVVKNESEANNWYKKAGEKNAAFGSRAYAENLRKGLGVTKDLTSAHFWAKKAIEQGSKEGHYTLGLVLEDLAALMKDESSEKESYLRRAHESVYKGDYYTRIDGTKSLARINKKIEQLQPIWGEVLPPSVDAGDVHDWRLLPKIIERNGTAYNGAYTNVGSTVFVLWHAFNKSEQTSTWFVDFDYRGSSNIASIKNISSDYSGDFYSMHISNTDEDITFTEMSTQAVPGGYRAVGKIGFRGVELLRGGSELSVSFWTTKPKTSRFRFGLNSPENAKESKPVIDELITRSKALDENCCVRSKIPPFTWEYWHNRDICEGLDIYTEKTADELYWFADHSRSQKEKERYKKEQTERCGEVRLPIVYKTPKKPIRVGDYIFTPKN